MHALPRNLILAVGLLGAGLAADHRAMSWSRALSPLQSLDMHAFPMNLGPWKGVDYETELTQSTRAYYGTDNFIDRVYTRTGRNPIELVLLPVGAGLHSPKVCARFGGLVIESERPARRNDPRDLDSFVVRSPENHNSLYACSYYWRKTGGVVHELPSALLPATHYADSLLVSLCTPMQRSEEAQRYAELTQFRNDVEPQLTALLQSKK